MCANIRLERAQCLRHRPRLADTFAYGKITEKENGVGKKKKKLGNSNKILELMRTVRARVIILDRPCDFLKNKTHSGGRRRRPC